MFYLFLGLYTISVIVIWGFFIVARIHAYKFKNFSPHIKKVTFALTASLAILTFFGYILVFSLKSKIDDFGFSNDTSGSILENIKRSNIKSNENTDVINYNDL